MHVVEWHPDDLIDLARRTGRADARVEAHLSRCLACRVAVQMATDFADLPVMASERPLQRREVVRRPWRRALAVTAATFVLATMSAYGVSRATDGAGARAGTPSAASDGSPAAKQLVAADDRLRSSASERASSARPTPSSRFETANRARLRQDYGDALREYRALIDAFPESTEAHVSQLIVARMLLDAGNAEEAITAFDAYLARGTPDLREEALEGRAIALEKLGRTSEAREAWRDVVRCAPLSPYAVHAVERIQLGMKP